MNNLERSPLATDFRLVFPNPNKARLVAAMVYYKGRLCFVTNIKHAAETESSPRVLLQPFGGGVEPGENDEEALFREIGEEGQLAPDDLTIVRDLGEMMTGTAETSMPVKVRSFVVRSKTEPSLPEKERHKLGRIVQCAHSQAVSMAKWHAAIGLRERVGERVLPASFVPNFRRYLELVVAGKTPWEGK